ncbi:MAG TPA: CHAT domain-containing protein [Vicinamibacterales bacterium]|nr:CHAT domain-containing protein [Vicinamibacterales bacterium]
MYAPGRHGDVIVQIVSAARHQSRSASEGGLQIYDALVYSQLAVPAAPPPHDRYPPLLRNLPLRGVERISIQPERYSNWLACFIEGEKGMEMMRFQLLEALSPGLIEMLTKAPVSIRVWWTSASPELDEFPWELTVDAGRRQGEHRVAFMRGLPSETPIPTIPLSGQPRLGVVGAAHLWPEWARVLAGEMGKSITVFDGPLRASLARAIAAGMEFVHVFADGIVSSALEGILYDHADSERPELPARELSQMLTGSRVAVLALSPTDYSNPDVQPMAGRSVLSAYRAFVFVGGSRLPLPTVLAPLGPVPDQMMADFWRTFYSSLTTSWHLTESLRTAHARFPYSAPIALFCRHAGGKLFEPASAPVEPALEPMTIRTELLQSQETTQDLSRLTRKYGQDLPAEVRELFEKETSRQTRLRGALDSWIPSGEDL